MPKGGVSKGESDFQGALREVREETGIDLSKIPEEKFADLGKHRYNKRKQLHLYVLQLEHPLNLNELTCESMVHREDREPYPEMSHYGMFGTNELRELLAPSMINWFQNHTNYIPKGQ